MTRNSVADLLANLQELDSIDTFADYCSGISTIALSKLSRKLLPLTKVLGRARILSKGRLKVEGRLN